jgi:hypothetical protein
MECGRQAALFSLRNQREIETKLAGRDISIGRTCQLDPDSLDICALSFEFLNPLSASTSRKINCAIAKRPDERVPPACQVMQEILLKIVEPATIWLWESATGKAMEGTSMRPTHSQVALLVVTFLVVRPQVGAEPPTKPKREQIGTVVGKPVYRDELHPKYPSPNEEDELHRLFLDPVLEKYVAAHRAELEPTKAELAAVEALLERPRQPKPVATTAEIRKSLQQVNDELSKKRSEFPRTYLEENKRQLEGMLRGEIPVPVTEDSQASPDTVAAEELKDVKSRLARNDLSLLERVSLTFDKWSWEQQLAHPARLFAPFLYGNWKLQRHFYDRFGRGRVLWQQAGLEAFDAYRRWIESEEQKGSFQITDRRLRSSFYHYWKRNDGSFITDPGELRRAFLEPEWVPRPPAQ